MEKVPWTEVIGMNLYRCVELSLRCVLVLRSVINILPS